MLCLLNVAKQTYRLYEIRYAMVFQCCRKAHSSLVSLLSSTHLSNCIYVKGNITWFICCLGCMYKKKEGKKWVICILQIFHITVAASMQNTGQHVDFSSQLSVDVRVLRIITELQLTLASGNTVFPLSVCKETQPQGSKQLLS